MTASNRLVFCFLFVLTHSCTSYHLLFGFVEAQQQGITQQTATLSQARAALAATSLGELVFFGGGQSATGVSDRVDIYNVTSGVWTTAILSVPRCDLAAASSGNLVFFAGGWDQSTNYYNQVDIYNGSNGSWSTATLRQARYGLAATSVGKFVLFAGGNSSLGPSNFVDIYNVASNTWTTATLTQSGVRAGTSVTNGYALFAAGFASVGDSITSQIVDIYNSQNGQWFTSTLSYSQTGFSATSIGNSAFFGGGSTIIEIYNSTNQLWTTATLTPTRCCLGATSLYDVVAFGGGWTGAPSTTVNVYNVTSQIWFTLSLSQARMFLAATSSTNQLFFGGGTSSSSNPITFSNTVDIFNILSPSSPQSPSSALPIPSIPSPFPTPSMSPSSYLTTTTSPLSNSSLPSPSSTSASPSTISSPFSQIPTLIPSSSQSSNLSAGAIVGIVLGVVALLIGIGVVFFLILLKRRQQQTNRSFKLTQQNSITEATSDLNYVTPTGTSQSQKTLSSQQKEYFTSIQATTKHFLISFNELTLEREIGEGSYGKVYLGKWNNIPVALKFCKNKGRIEEFMNEVKLLLEVPPHPNIVQMLGISMTGPQPTIVLEYCAGGSLDKLLFDSNVKLSNENKLRLIRGIATGMLHLHKFNIIHRDLAARNILLTERGEPKISDFGMSRFLEKNNEGKTFSNIGPIRWMAPESLAQNIYSKKSDVWTFGIVVWEIVVQSEPHANVPALDVGILIRDYNLTPPIPKNCIPLLRQLMEMCWRRNPEQRPSFEVIWELLK